MDNHYLMLKPISQNNNIFYFITGKKRKRLWLKDLHSDQSEFDEDVSPRKRIPNFISSDSDLKSYDRSSRRGKEPASRRSYIKKAHLLK